ncbi:hypothetical protein [Streptomyces sp. NPDC005568]|uniref:hypothetical protein n=1 Tax=Streptomyces sp. NPDC005568 TaxID=3156887 RepID=UPI0033BAC7CE
METTQRTDQQRSADRRRRELLEAADRVVLRDGPVRLRDGVYERQWAAATTKKVDFGDGPTTVATNPWRADLLTAAHSTGISTIDTYTALPALVRVLMSVAARTPGVFTSAPWRAVTSALVRRLPSGPSETDLAKGSSQVWAQVTAPDGRQATAVLHGPEAYEFTARTAIAVLQQVLDSRCTPGFRTPASEYGPDLVLSIPGVSRHDIAETHGPH